ECAGVESVDHVIQLRLAESTVTAAGDCAGCLDAAANVGSADELIVENNRQRFADIIAGEVAKVFGALRIEFESDLAFAGFEDGISPLKRPARLAFLVHHFFAVDDVAERPFLFRIIDDYTTVEELGVFDLRLNLTAGDWIVENGNQAIHHLRQ